MRVHEELWVSISPLHSQNDIPDTTGHSSQRWDIMRVYHSADRLEWDSEVGMGSEGVRTTPQSVHYNCVRIWMFCFYRRGAGGLQACSKSTSGCKRCELRLVNLKLNLSDDYLSFRNCLERMHTDWAAWLATEQSLPCWCIYTASIRVPPILV